MSDTYTEITGVKPATISKDGERVRFILRTANADLYLEFPRTELQGLIRALRDADLAAELIENLGPRNEAALPTQSNIRRH